MISRTYSIEPEVFDLAPDFCRGVVIASSVNNAAPQNANLEQKFRDLIASVGHDTTLSLHHNRIAAWRKLYKNLGLNDIQPSIAALVRRIKNGRGGDIPFISPLVCISNLVSLSFLVPSGLVDAAAVKGNFVLGRAQGNEIFEPIGGTGSNLISRGEVIYYDSATRNVMCRGLNSRGGKVTRIQPETSRVVIDVDALLSVISEEEWHQAVNLVSDLVQQHCGASTTVQFLSKNNMSIELPPNE